jgi:hypothetical protein
VNIQQHSHPKIRARPRAAGLNFAAPPRKKGREGPLVMIEFRGSAAKEGAGRPLSIS